MTDSAFFIVELEVKPGQVDDLRKVARDMVAATRADEPGTLNYEYFLSADGTTCYIYERYADEAAVLAHSATFPEELSKRGHAFRPTRLTVYGKITEAIQRRRIDPLLKAVPGIRVVMLEPLAGLAH
jgi:quinol monooxygenase YgiN